MPTAHKINFLHHYDVNAHADRKRIIIPKLIRRQLQGQISLIIGRSHNAIFAHKHDNEESLQAVFNVLGLDRQSLEIVRKYAAITRNAKVNTQGTLTMSDEEAAFLRMKSKNPPALMIIGEGPFFTIQTRPVGKKRLKDLAIQ